MSHKNETSIIFGLNIGIHKAFNQIMVYMVAKKVTLLKN